MVSYSRSARIELAAHSSCSALCAGLTPCSTPAHWLLFCQKFFYFLCFQFSCSLVWKCMRTIVVMSPTAAATRLAFSCSLFCLYPATAHFPAFPAMFILLNFAFAVRQGRQGCVIGSCSLTGSCAVAVRGLVFVDTGAHCFVTTYLDAACYFHAISVLQVVRSAAARAVRAARPRPRRRRPCRARPRQACRFVLTLIAMHTAL